MSGHLFCVLVLNPKIFVLAALALSACYTEAGEWQEVPLDLPEAETDLVYLRQSMPNFVGTEQWRRLYVGGRDTVDLPVQPGGREPVNVYLDRDSAGVLLRFDEGWNTTTINLRNLEVTESRVALDSLGQFVGAFVSPEIRDLRFVPASEGGAVEFSR